MSFSIQKNSLGRLCSEAYCIHFLSCSIYKDLFYEKSDTFELLALGLLQKISNSVAMIRGSVLCEQYAAQAAQTARPSSQISSPISSLADPRFSQILTRAANGRERLSRHQVSPTDLIHSPSMVTMNSNAWLPSSEKNEKTGSISSKMLVLFRSRSH